MKVILQEGVGSCTKESLLNSLQSNGTPIETSTSTMSAEVGRGNNFIGKCYLPCVEAILKATINSTPVSLELAAT